MARTKPEVYMDVLWSQIELLVDRQLAGLSHDQCAEVWRGLEGECAAAAMSHEDLASGGDSE